MENGGRTRVGLTVGGLDPSSGAGVTADLQTFAAHGVFGTCAVTGLTVQSTRGVEAVRAVEPAWLRRTLNCLWDDVPAAGVKLGMLGGAAGVEAVAGFLEERGALERLPVVFDPVLRSSSGAVLTAADETTLSAIRERLLRQVGWITPNWAELGVLTGVPVDDLEGAAEAARRLGGRHRHLHIVATGGEAAVPVDWLRLADGSEHRIEGERVETESTHGTGCAFSTALLCRLMEGRAAVEAVQLAKLFVTEALRQAPGLGSGHGPMGLLWPLQQGRTPDLLG